MSPSAVDNDTTVIGIVTCGPVGGGCCGVETGVVEVISAVVKPANIGTPETDVALNRVSNVLADAAGVAVAVVAVIVAGAVMTPTAPETEPAMM